MLPQQVWHRGYCSHLTPTPLARALTAKHKAFAVLNAPLPADLSVRRCRFGEGKGLHTCGGLVRSNT